MSVTDLIRAAMNVALFLLFAAAAWSFLRQPRLDRGLIALLFALAAAVLGLGVIEDVIGREAPSWMSRLLTLAIPLVTLRAVGELAPVSALAYRLTGAGLVVSTLMAATLPGGGASGPGVLAIAIYVVAVEGYAAWLSVAEARRTHGVIRARLLAVALGSLLLGVTLLLIQVPSLAALIPVTGLLSVISYYLGFITPSALRHIWQAEDLGAYVRDASVAAQLSDTDQVLAALARAAARTLGVTVAAAGIRGADPDTVHIVTAEGAVHDSAIDVPVGGRSMRLGRAVAGVPAAAAVWGRGMEMALAAPVIVGGESIGFLSVFARRRALLLEEDLRLMQLLADQAAIVLQNRRMYDEVRSGRAELEHRLQELNAVNEELSAFAYSVSHDLRAPLRSLDGFSSALLDRYEDALDDTGKRYLRFVRESSVEMAALIDALLRLSMVSRSEMKREEVDLSSLASDVIARLREADPDRSVGVRIEPGMTAVGDVTLVRGALENLLGNAWKFTSRRAHAEIVFGRVDPGRATFFVRDNGAGFDMRYAGKLFSAFQRLHARDEFPGTGVGLATVQRVVRRHGGQVWASSEPGRGTTFYFTLEPGIEAPEAYEGQELQEEMRTA